MRSEYALPLVSVITTVKNGSTTIKATIDSVLNQDYSNIEYIIIDGGSVDDTVSVIKQTINSKVYFFSEADGGVYYGMNKGILKANGEVIAILNSGDCYIDRWVISKVVKEYNRTSNKLAVFNFGIRLVDHNGKTLADVIRTKSIMALKFFIMPINHPSFFVSKEVYKKYGIYNTRFKIAADYDFVLRLSQNKVKISFFSDITTIVAPLGLSSYSGNTAKLLKEAYLVRSSYLIQSVNILINIILYFVLIFSRIKKSF